MVDQQRDGVLVIGESLVDIVEHPTGAVFEAPGGSPLNVAVTLARLGVRTHLLTALGDDERADRIEAHLDACGVSLLGRTRCLRRTSTAAARMQDDASARYEFDVAWSPPATPSPPVRAIHAGSLGLFVEPGAAAVLGHLESAGDSALVSLDPNIRPSLLPGHGIVLTRFERLLPLAHIVKLSDEDAAWLYPGLDEGRVIERLLGSGPTLVAITRGAAGCVLASGDALVELPSAPAAVIDTIGAGDSFMGALLHQALLRDLVDDLTSRQQLWPEELVAMGGAAAEVAAVTVSRPGADPPHLAELTL